MGNKPLFVRGSTYREAVKQSQESYNTYETASKQRQETENKYNEEFRLRMESEAKNAKYEAEKREAARRKLEKPWRDFEANGGWTQEYRNDLATQIQNHKVYRSQKRVKILFLGPIRAGKSLFINSVASIDKNRIASPMLVGEAEKSMSTKFNTREPIDKEDTSHFKQKPKAADKAPCVVIVMDSMVIASDSITTEAKKKIQELQKHIREKDVPVVMLLTKIDYVWEEIESQTSFVYQSRDMEIIVRKASEIFGVTIKDIFPIRNYSEEQHLDVEMDILILLALQRMLDYANDRLEKIGDQESDFDDKK